MSTQTTRNVEWRCDFCHVPYLSEREAARCEEHHRQIIARKTAYQETLAAGKPLIGMLSHGDDDALHLTGVLAILCKSDPDRPLGPKDETTYTVSDACTSFDDFLPDPTSPYRKYVSITEAIEAGWVPFFSQHYQKTFPLALREQIAEDFLSLPNELQKQHLLLRRLMTRSNGDL